MAVDTDAGWFSICTYHLSNCS